MKHVHEIETMLTQRERSQHIDPVLDDPQRDADYIAKYPEYGYPNVWPQELPEFKEAFQEVRITCLPCTVTGHESPLNLAHESK